MTVLALKAARAANGVSELHGAVSLEMWWGLYSNGSVDEVPIGHVTNGIHLAGWTKGPVRKFWRRKLGQADPGADWSEELAKPEFWARAEDPAFVSDTSIANNLIETPETIAGHLYQVFGSVRLCEVSQHCPRNSSGLAHLRSHPV